MPKVDGLTAKERKALLAEGMGDEPGEEIASPAPLTPTAPVTASVPPPAPVLAADTAALIQMLASAIAQSGATNAETIKQALSDQAAMARAPIAETYLSGNYPGQSVFSHPDGDLKHSRTELRCPMFMAVANESGHATPWYEIEAASCREDERVLLNALQPGTYVVESNNGAIAKWRVVEQLDDLDQPTRLLIVIPRTWASKAEQAQMPAMLLRDRRGRPVSGFLKQLTDAAESAA